MSSVPRQSVQDGDWTYTLDEPIGRGGFATVYRATMERGAVRRRVALKVLQLSAAEDPEAVARLRDEAAILGRLEHDAIVRVLGTVEVLGRPAVVMDLIDGIDLRRILALEPLQARVVCQLGADLADALDAAWSDPDPLTGEPLRVIHRDVKPANVLCTRRGAVRLVDFGVARASLDRDGTTRSVHQFGTARYMAPERFDDETTHRSDIYALGVTLVEAYTGQQFDRLPVRRERYSAALAERMRQVWDRGGPVPWRTELVALLESMLHYEEARRPDARKVARRLAELADEAEGEGARRVLPALVTRALEQRRHHQVETLPLHPPLEPAPTAPSEPEASGSLALQPASGFRSVRGGLVVAAGLFTVAAGAIPLVLWKAADREIPVLEPLPAAPGAAPAADDASVDVFVELGEQELADQAGGGSAEDAPPAPAPTHSMGPSSVVPPVGEESASADTIPVSFRLAVGAGGTVVVDSVEHALPHGGRLGLGLHAVTFRHRDHESHQMIYVGAEAPDTYVYDPSTETIHAFD